MKIIVYCNFFKSCKTSHYNRIWCRKYIKDINKIKEIKKIQYRKYRKNKKYRKYKKNSVNICNSNEIQQVPCNFVLFIWFGMLFYTSAIINFSFSPFEFYNRETEVKNDRKIVLKNKVEYN